MTDEANADTRGSSSGGFHWLLWTFFILAVYILSTGPALKLHRAGMLPDPEPLYLPLIWLSWNVPLANDFLRWYVKGLWHAG